MYYYVILKNAYMTNVLFMVVLLIVQDWKYYFDSMFFHRNLRLAQIMTFKCYVHGSCMFTSPLDVHVDLILISPSPPQLL